MKKLLFILASLIISVFVLSSCKNQQASNDNETASDADSIIETSENDAPIGNELMTISKDLFNKEELGILTNFFSDSLINAIAIWVTEMKNVKTDAEMAKLYAKAELLSRTMSESAQNDYETDPYTIILELAKLDSSILCLYPTCVAECTEFEYTYSLTSFQDIAKNTQGTADNNFFQLMISAYGETGGQPHCWLNFFERTWDYGGGSLLGDNACYDFLMASWTAMSASDLFKSDYMQVREKCIEDMSHTVYMHSKKEVMAEIESIINAGILNPEELKRMKELKSRNLDATQNVQFDCRNMDCDFGG